MQASNPSRLADAPKLRHAGPRSGSRAVAVHMLAARLALLVVAAFTITHPWLETGDSGAVHAEGRQGPFLPIASLPQQVPTVTGTWQPGAPDGPMADARPMTAARKWQTLSEVDIFKRNSGRDLAVVAGERVYLYGAGELVALDVRQPERPAEVARQLFPDARELSVRPGQTWVKGKLWEMATAGAYLYAVGRKGFVSESAKRSPDDVPTLFVIEASPSQALRPAASLPLAGDPMWVETARLSLSADGRQAQVLTSSSYDVSYLYQINLADPLAPRLVSRATLPYPVRGAAWMGRYLVVAADDRDAAPGDAGLHVLDVRDPARPKALGFVARKRASAVVTAGNYAFLVRYGQCVDQPDEPYGIEMFDLADPNRPRLAGGITTVCPNAAGAASRADGLLATGAQPIWASVAYPYLFWVEQDASVECLVTARINDPWRPRPVDRVCLDSRGTFGVPAWVGRRLFAPIGTGSATVMRLRILELAAP